MLVLIGTGHIFDLSSPLLSLFDEKNPDVICVELDKQRYNSLKAKEVNPEGYKAARKNLPIVYKLLARFQNSLAKEYGVAAGDEMLTAIKYAKNRQIPIEFIDMNAQILFTKMLRSMSLSEKLKLLFTGFGGFFISRKRVEKELGKFEKDFDFYLEEIGKKFPTIKRVLIDERNSYMAQKLYELTEEYVNVVALVGDGHIPGVSELLRLKEVEFETIRLSELRSLKPSDLDSATVSFTMEYKEPD
jgi:pheromone shutdown protein TraB